MSGRRLAVMAALAAFGLGFTSHRLHAQQPAQTTTLSGVVVDASTGEPVASALVSLSPSNRQAIADSVGAYRFTDVPVGEHTVVVQRIGYVRLALSLRLDPRPIPLELRLSPDPVALEGLTVTGGQPVRVGGTVKDAVSGEALPFAGLWITPDAVRATAEGFADEQGAFAFDDVPSGPYLLGARLVGYVTQYVPVLVSPPGEPFEVFLEPDSLVLKGLPLLTREFHVRRNAYWGIAVPYTADQLARSPEKHALDFLVKETWITPHPCSGPGLCLLWSGRVVSPTVYIDDRPLCGGDQLSYLTSFYPGEFYLVEVFGGSLVRAYTHEYIEGQARRQGERPHMLPPPLVCPL